MTVYTTDKQLFRKNNEKSVWQMSEWSFQLDFWLFLIFGVRIQLPAYINFKILRFIAKKILDR